MLAEVLHHPTVVVGALIAGIFLLRVSCLAGAIALLIGFVLIADQFGLLPFALPL